jgi:type II secretory pathway pseudopilin PulG
MKTSRHAGFTLMETLVSVFIFVAILGAAVPVYQRAQEFFVRGRIRMELQSQSRTALDTILSNLRQARANSVQIDNFAGAPPYSHIRFRFATTNRQCDIFLQNRQINLVLYGDFTKPLVLAHDVRFLTFTGTTSDPAVLSVSLELVRHFGSKGREAAGATNFAVRLVA